MLEVEQAAQNIEAQARLDAQQQPLAAARPPRPPPRLGAAASRAAEPQPAEAAPARGRASAETPTAERSTPPLESPSDPTGSGEHDEVVAVDDLTAGTPSGRLGAAPAGHRRARGCASARHQALGEHLAVGAGDLDGVVGVEVAVAPRRRPAAQQRPPPLEQRPAGPVVDHDACPAEPTAKAIQSLRAGRRAVVGLHDGADAGRAGDGIGQHAVAVRRAAMTVRTPDQAAILAAASFEAMPPLPPAAAGAAGHGLELVVDLDDLLDERGRRRRGGDRR